MNKTMIFTVQIPENGKPIVYAQMATEAYRLNQSLAEALIRDWIEDNGMSDIKPSELEDIAYTMRKEGFVWWKNTVCFELTEV